MMEVFRQKNYILPGYHLTKEIGQGTIGTVFEGCHETKNKKIAVKVEVMREVDSDTKIDGVIHLSCSLLAEKRAYRRLNSKDSIGIAKMKRLKIGTGLSEGLCFLVMELLGPNLKTLLKECGKFNLKTVLLLADQLIRILQYIHSKGYVHLSVKPKNIVIGRKGKKKQLYMVDFGRSEMYRHRKTMKHHSCEKRRPFNGTLSYASLNVLQKLRPSRRDDMESLGYLLFYFLNGSLPWQDLSRTHPDTCYDTYNKRRQRKYDLAYKVKKDTSIEKELCSGHPSEFCTYLEYCRSLQFDEEPDYSYLCKLFKDLFERSGFKDSEFDWEEKDMTKDETEGYSSESSLSVDSTSSNESTSSDEEVETSDEEVETVYVPYSDTVLKKLQTVGYLNSTPTSLKQLENMYLQSDDVECAKTEHEQLNNEVRHNTPFDGWPPLAFSKVTGQLVAAMYAILVEDYKLTSVKHMSTGSTQYDCMGLFVMNDMIYLAKAELKEQYIKNILSSNSPAGLEGPNVCYSEWYFDLKKPNARLGFLIFMYFHKLIRKCEIVARK